MSIVGGLLMAGVGAFLAMCATLRSEFVIYRLLAARSRLLCRDHVHRFHQVVGAILITLGLLWALGIIW